MNNRQMKKTTTFTLLVRLLCTITLPLSAQEKYMEPPREIMEMMMAKPIPQTIFSNNYKKYAEVQRDDAMKSIAYISAPEYRVAGININPANFSASRIIFISNSIRLCDVATGKIVEIAGMPQEAQISGVKWSPNDTYIGFLHHTQNEVQLWRIDVATATAEKINQFPLNCVLSKNDPYVFLDDERILYTSVPEDIGTIPQPPVIPNGPIIQENYGKTKVLETYSNVLTSYYDEQLFDYFTTTQFILFSPQGSFRIGPKAIVRSFTLSPNKNYMLVTTEHRPYSYLETHNGFPSKLEIWSIQGQVMALLESKAGEEENTSASADNKKAPRKSGYAWRDDMPETLVWTETSQPIQKDEGKKEEAEQKFTTAIYQQHAPFNGQKELVIRPENKIGSVTWGNGKFALYTETSTKEKIRNTLSFVPCDTTKTPRLLYTESTEIDSLSIFPIIGKPYMVTNNYGVNVVYVDDKLTHLYFTGARRDSEGDNMNFIDRFDLKTKKAINLWTGKAPYNESIEAITDFKNVKFISLKQSVKDVPNYFIVDPKTNKWQQITFNTDPCPSIRAIQSRFITYQRKDGVRLTARLYLPEGYDPEKDGKLPVFMWGYPHEYKSVALAERARPTRYTFTVLSHAFLVTQGYAVLDGFSMYIISNNTKQQPNDLFREQLIMNAEAAINYIDSIGIGDKNRVGVGGHSYGAFMTANLLAHTKLFKAGIAQSGAYNRTLTHNGFQTETRTYWKAPQLYFEMSPFAYANQIKTPLLLVHGQEDNNTGTFPIQSQRLYHALVGLGGNVRYVQLPHETHGYITKESQFHVMYEIVTFLDKHVKNANEQ